MNALTKMFKIFHFLCQACVQKSDVEWHHVGYKVSCFEVSLEFNFRLIINNSVRLRIKFLARFFLWLACFYIKVQLLEKESKNANVRIIPQFGFENSKTLLFFLPATDVSHFCTSDCTSCARKSWRNARRSWATTWWRPTRGQNTTARTASNSSSSPPFLPPRLPRAQRAACVARAAATRLPASSWGPACQRRRPLWPFPRAWSRSSTSTATISVSVTSFGRWRTCARTAVIVKVRHMYLNYFSKRCRHKRSEN